MASSKVDDVQILNQDSPPSTPPGEDKKARQQPYRYDAVLWLFGFLFLSILHSLMFGIGKFTLILN